MDRDDFTVGLICALPRVELPALLASLDNPNDSTYERAGSDDNDYHYGQICRHNVVITCLPAGEYGIVSAALTVADMRRTHESINTWLFVGIGGALRREIDLDGVQYKIQLGDIAVGLPNSNSPGAVQWDRVKLEDEARLIGFLKAPPLHVRSAVGSVQAKTDMGLSKFNEHLKHIQSNLARAERSYQRPTPGGCTTYYGTIASGSSVVKSELWRDDIRRRLADSRAICVEMEAAGVMSKVECLVIRGISDYADKSKNDAWQRYAAAAAAAYAREVLNRLAPSKSPRPSAARLDQPQPALAVSQSSSQPQPTLAVSQSSPSAAPDDRKARVRSLCKAICADDVAQIDSLWRQGHDERHRDIEGNTLVHLAVAAHQVQAVRELHRRGVDVQARNVCGQAPVEFAAVSGQVEMVQVLHELGQPLARRGVDGSFLVHLAARSGRVEVLKFLKEQGCDLRVKDAHGKRPVAYAKEEGWDEVVKFMKQKK